MNESTQEAFVKKCPHCGSRDVEVNTWEAWCYACNWQLDKGDNPELVALYREARLNEVRGLQPILEAELAELDRVMSGRSTV